MGRSFLGGFLGALLALALVGVVLGVRGQSPQAEKRATLLRQIDEYERWRRDDPSGQGNIIPRTDELHRQYLSWHPELSAYMAYYAGRYQQEQCGGRSLICDIEIGEMFRYHLRDPRYLDAYLAARR